MTNLLPFLPAAMLFGSLLDGLPYAYFQLLRWVVCISAGLWAYHGYERDDKLTMAIFIPIAILFNPIAPVYLRRGTWIPIDVISGLLFLARGGLAGHRWQKEQK